MSSPMASGLKPPDLDEGILAEHAEGAGDDEQSAQATPRGPAGDEGPQVLDHLEGCEQSVGTDGRDRGPQPPCSR